MTRGKEATLVADAAGEVRELAESADPALWAKAWHAVGRTDDHDAALIALMSPAVGIAVAEFLEAVVAWDDEHSKGLTWTQPVPARALAIAHALTVRPSRE